MSKIEEANELEAEWAAGQPLVPSAFLWDAIKILAGAVVGMLGAIYMVCR